MPPVAVVDAEHAKGWSELLLAQAGTVVSQVPPGTAEASPYRQLAGPCALCQGLQMLACSLTSIDECCSRPTAALLAVIHAPGGVSAGRLSCAADQPHVMCSGNLC